MNSQRPRRPRARNEGAGASDLQRPVGVGGAGGLLTTCSALPRPWVVETGPLRLECWQGVHGRRWCNYLLRSNDQLVAVPAFGLGTQGYYAIKYTGSLRVAFRTIASGAGQRCAASYVAVILAGLVFTFRGGPLSLTFGSQLTGGSSWDSGIIFTSSHTHLTRTGLG